MLLRRLAGRIDPHRQIEVLQPVRSHRSKMTNAPEAERYLGLTISKLGAADGAVLVLLDADDDCAASLGPELLDMCNRIRPDLPVSVATCGSAIRRAGPAGSSSSPTTTSSGTTHTSTGPGSETPWTKDLWIYDLRTNQHFKLKQNRLTRADLGDFVACYRPGAIGQREETERFKRFAYDELVALEKASLDIFWLRDESLEDTDNLPAPGIIAAEIVEDLEAALEEFRAFAESLEGIGVAVDNVAEAD